MTVPAGCPLTANQLDIIERIANEQTPGEIAHASGRSESTIRAATHAARAKLSVTDTLQAAIRCWSEGWIRIAGVTPEAKALAQRDARGLVIKPAHRVYLYAFDLYVAAKTDDEKRAARAIMDHAAAETGIPTGRPDKHPDLVDLLVSHIARERATRRTTARREAA